MDDMIPVPRKPSERNVAGERRKPPPPGKNQTNGQSGAPPQSDPIPPMAGFFEQPDFFRTLTSSILPQLLKSKISGDLIRVWVPGVATGEELYSIAICLLEALGDWSASVPIRLFGTDI